MIFRLRLLIINNKKVQTFFMFFLHTNCSILVFKIGKIHILNVCIIIINLTDAHFR